MTLNIKYFVAALLMIALSLTASACNKENRSTHAYQEQTETETHQTTGIADPDPASDEGKSTQAQEFLSLGRTAYEENDLATAVHNLISALDNDPSLPGTHLLLGKISVSYKQGNYALNHFNAELEIAPDDIETHLALGCLWALASIPPGDPNQVRYWLLGKFNDILPYNWPRDLVLNVDRSMDPLTRSIYHFVSASETDPGNPSSEIGLALVEIAVYNLINARERLLQLYTNTSDEKIHSIIQAIIDDIHREEQYRQIVAGSTDTESGFASIDDVATIVDETETVPDEAAVGPPPSEIRELPSLTGDGIPDPGDNTTRPTVKPISDDIYIEATGEWVRTVRLVNIYNFGEVGFREGETLMMPNTGVIVKVVESGEDRIVLEENGDTYVWVRGEVGWILESGATPDDGRPDLNITAYFPDDEPSDESETPEDETDEDETDEDEMDEGTPVGDEPEETIEELGPEVTPG